MRDLRGKSVVVTGAAGGIGRAISRTFADLGSRVVIADLDLDQASEFAEHLGEGHCAMPIDVTSSDSVRGVVEAVANQLGRIDVWVNNAGIVVDALTIETTDEDWQRTLAVNLTGTFFGAREAAKLMARNGAGSIINISSIAGFKAGKPENHVAYDVTKAGVSHMARIMASELASTGVRVNAVAPGYTNTELLSQVGSHSPDVMAQWMERVPQGRLIEPEEIGQVVAFLGSDTSSSITGQTILADAGYMTR